MPSLIVHLLESNDDEHMVCGLPRARGRRFLNLRRRTGSVVHRRFDGHLCPDCRRIAAERGLIDDT